MGQHVFISYRRSRDAHFAGRLFDALLVGSAARRVFMDVDSIEVGRDFIASMHDAIVASDVILVVIGKGWATVKDGGGKPRLHNVDDPVAFELRTAISLSKAIIPVLVENASMPKASALPEDLRVLVRLNAHQIRHASFRSDVLTMLAVMDRLPSEERSEASSGIHITAGGNSAVGDGVAGDRSEPPLPNKQQLHNVLRRAITQRQAATQQDRYEVYDEGRAALARYLDAQVPPLTAEEHAARRLLFEDCILEEEAERETVTEKLELPLSSEAQSIALLGELAGSIAEMISPKRSPTD